MTGHLEANQPQFEVVADHRMDRLETIVVPQSRAPKLMFILHCKCGEHSEGMAEARLAHSWHEFHRESVMEEMSSGKNS